jgi:hypothetical protein
MGKSERELVKKAEQIVCKLLNEESLTAEDRRHELFSLCRSFATKLKADFPTIQRARHIGNEYKTVGDIRLELRGGGIKFIELKFLDEEGGTGTLANISQDALTQYGLIEAESRSDFLKRKRHYEWVADEFRKVPGYSNLPAHVKQSRIHEVAGELKELIGVGRRNAEFIAREVLADRSALKQKRLAAQAIINITKRDRNEKIEYIRDLKQASASINRERLKRFTLLLLTGNHTADLITEEIEKPIETWINRDDYEIYYGYKGSGEVVREDMAHVRSLANCEYDLEFRDDQVNIIVFRTCAGARTDTLRIVVHWKNKFQGIQTPCLNIFKED